MLKGKIEAVNKLHTWLNVAVPELKALITKGYSRKVDGPFYKKDALQFKKITDTAPFRAWIDTGRDDLTLNADITYPTSEHSVNYYKRVICLSAKYNKAPLYALKKVEKARTEKLILQSKINRLTIKIRTLNTLEE